MAFKGMKESGKLWWRIDIKSMYSSIYFGQKRLSHYLKPFNGMPFFIIY
jgi:hypothetical protein